MERLMLFGNTLMIRFAFGGRILSDLVVGGHILMDLTSNLGKKQRKRHISLCVSSL